MRVLCPFLPLLEEVYTAEMIILQEGAGECPKRAVAWLREQQSLFCRKLTRI